MLDCIGQLAAAAAAAAAFVYMLDYTVKLICLKENSYIRLYFQRLLGITCNWSRRTLQLLNGNSNIYIYLFFSVCFWNTRTYTRTWYHLIYDSVLMHFSIFIMHRKCDFLHIKGHFKIEREGNCQDWNFPLKLAATKPGAAVKFESSYYTEKNIHAIFAEWETTSYYSKLNFPI